MIFFGRRHQMIYSFRIFCFQLLQPEFRRMQGFVAPPATGAYQHSFGSYFLTVFLSFATGIMLTLVASRRAPATVRGVARTVVDLRGEQTKMALVVRRDLKMGVGKIAAQCAHAAVAAVDEIHSRAPAGGATTGAEGAAPSQEHEWQMWLDAWNAVGCAKVVLQVDSEDAIDKLLRDARAAKLPAYLVRDAGRTQIAAGSKTVLAVGPAPVSRVDQVTGSLKLL
jgi:PTH2 family peptidyl-tRNA hydrolase